MVAHPTEIWKDMVQFHGESEKFYYDSINTKQNVILLLIEIMKNKLKITMVIMIVIGVLVIKKFFMKNHK